MQRVVPALSSRSLTYDASSDAQLRVNASQELQSTVESWKECSQVRITGSVIVVYLREVRRCVLLRSEDET